MGSDEILRPKFRNGVRWSSPRCGEAGNSVDVVGSLNLPRPRYGTVLAAIALLDALAVVTERARRVVGLGGATDVVVASAGDAVVNATANVLLIVSAGLVGVSSGTVLVGAVVVDATAALLATTPPDSAPSRTSTGVVFLSLRSRRALPRAMGTVEMETEADGVGSGPGLPRAMAALESWSAAWSVGTAGWAGASTGSSPGPGLEGPASAGASGSGTEKQQPLSARVRQRPGSRARQARLSTRPFNVAVRSATSTTARGTQLLRKAGGGLAGQHCQQVRARGRWGSFCFLG